MDGSKKYLIFLQRHPGAVLEALAADLTAEEARCLWLSWSILSSRWSKECKLWLNCFSLKVNSLLVNDEETNGSGGEMEEAVEEEIEVFHVFLSKMKIEILVCQLDFEQPAHVKVANVTRAGCEKASTGQFELLR